MTTYGYRKRVSGPFESAVSRVKEALQKEGFGVLTEINVQETLKKKLGVESKKYLILGVCNPPFAHQALCAEKEIGLLLPCNVIVYEDKGVIYASAIKPTVAMEFIQNSTLRLIAEQVEEKLEKAMNTLPA